MHLLIWDSTMAHFCYYQLMDTYIENLMEVNMFQSQTTAC